MIKQHFAAIGLGGNLGDAPANLCFALQQLNAHPHISLTATSPLYRSVAIGPAGQPDYANAAASLSTTLTPHELLSALQDIEHLAGRERIVRWGARTLDLDLLLYDDITLDGPQLTIPHRELCNRAFVLVPLATICADARLPNGQLISALAENCSLDELTSWPDPRWPTSTL